MNTFLHYFKYNLINRIISIKIKIEYKIHFLADLLYMIMNSIVLVLFAYVLDKNFSSIIGWEFIDFISFFFLVNIMLDVGYSFITANTLSKYYLKTGKLNILLSKPGNIFLNYLLLHNRATQLFYFLFKFLFFFPFVIYFQEITIINLLIASLYSIFLGFTMLNMLIFLDSFSWRLLDLGDILYNFFFDSINEFLRYYPSIFFEKFNFSYIIQFFPIYYVAIYGIPLLSGEFTSLFSSINFLLIINVIIISITILNWRFGLKHYQALN